MESPRSPLWPGDAPPPGLSPEGSNTSSCSFPKHAEARLLWETVLYSRLCPLCFPQPRASGSASQNPEALGAGGFSWAGPQCRSSSFSLLRPQNWRVSPGVEGAPVSTPICFFL